MRKSLQVFFHNIDANYQINLSGCGDWDETKISVQNLLAKQLKKRSGVISSQ